ncbi:hypothetical protein POM88_003329 [Heracleum sosnowskyi]|uniref:Mitochondrial glycoprotein n=1 Tax=Heracleum sosnowskyi TaxID=360622 RepID=A0AAD8JHU3_9APIA|nr:hypothetical protein POM88_003329 [Heracleum sosnowskyi]
MAASTILLRKSSACLIGSGSQLYGRYLSTAAKRSHTIIPTSVFSGRRFSSSSPLNNETTARDYAQQPANNQPTITEILAEIESVRKEIESIRKERKGKKEPPVEEVVVVKEKHPLLKIIELEMSKSEQLNRESMKLQLPYVFDVESDKPGAATVTLKGTHENEIINIELSIPAHYVMLLTVKLTLSGRFSGFFNSTEAVFHCTLTSNGFEVVKIKEPHGSDHGILFYNLPEDLKDEFYKYLEIRGVYKENVAILYRYMVGRTNRENLKGLESFKKMVEAA